MAGLVPLLQEISQILIGIAIGIVSDLDLGIFHSRILTIDSKVATLVSSDIHIACLLLQHDILGLLLANVGVAHVGSLRLLLVRSCGHDFASLVDELLLGTKYIVHWNS